MTDPATPGITRHFITLGARQVHYRRGGAGPPILVLHRLPRTSKDLVPVITTLMPRFTVIAPDLAGYGNSWPLAAPQPTVRAYADDLAALLEALGIRRCVAYGEGEGGVIALALAAHHATRVAAVAVQGLFVAESTEAASAWLEPFVPSWDGRHFAWLWARLREENAFAPPWTHTLASRIDEPMPAPAELQSRAVQFITGPGHGRAYDVGLRAVLGSDLRGIIAQLTIPHVITGARARGDHVGLERLGAGQAVATVAEARRAAFDFLTAQAHGLTPPGPAPRPKPVAGRLWSDFARVPDGQLHFHMNGDADTVPLLVQHDAASSVGTVEPITRSFIGRRTVMAFDMPGSGESDCTIGSTVDVQAYADVLQTALDDLGLPQIDFYGMWGGGFVGLDLALAQPERVRRLVMSNVFQHDGEEQRRIQAFYTPDVSPHWHGGHLLQCWHQMRDQGIYYPWFESSRQGIIWREPFLATDMVHERVCSLMKAGNMYRTAYQAHFRYRTYERIARAPVPTVIATTTWDPNNAHTQAAARAAPNAQFRLLDEDFLKWGLSFLDFLEAA
jgi:pimeloyl-ACP methyl ester carboxylesterase